MVVEARSEVESGSHPVGSSGTRYSFEREGGMVESMAEIDRWYSANPKPSGYQLFERVVPGMVALRADRPGEIGEWLHFSAIGEVVTLEQAARLVLPMMDEVLAGRPGEFLSWAERYFFDYGLDRDEARKIVQAGRDERADDKAEDKGCRSGAARQAMEKSA